MTARVESQDAYEAGQARALADGVAVTAAAVNVYQAQIEDFSAAVREDRQPLCSGEAGLWSQKVLAACYEASRTGSAVEV